MNLVFGQLRRACSETSAHIAFDELFRWFSSSSFKNTLRVDAGRCSMGVSQYCLDRDDPETISCLRERPLYGAFHGHLYEREEVAERIGARNLRSLSDGDLLLRLYARLGVDGFSEYNVDCVACVWDPPRNHLSLIRSPMGHQQLFYIEDERFVAFSSLKSALLSLPGIDRGINYRKLGMAHLPVPEVFPSQTLHSSVRRLLPAQCVRCDLEGSRSWRFFSFRSCIGQQRVALGDVEEGMREHIRVAVAVRMKGEKYGTQFSGGLDSAGVTSIAASLTADTVCAFSAVPETLTGDDIAEELTCARSVADMYGNIQHVQVGSEGLGPLSCIEDSVTRYDEIVSAFYYAERALSAKARSMGVDHLLTGYGGDLLVSHRGVGSLAGVFRREHRWRCVLTALASFRRHDDLRSFIRTEIARPVLPRLFMRRGKRGLKTMFPKMIQRSVLNEAFVRDYKLERFYVERF